MLAGSYSSTIALFPNAHMEWRGQKENPAFIAFDFIFFTKLPGTVSFLFKGTITQFKLMSNTKGQRSRTQPWGKKWKKPIAVDWQEEFNNPKNLHFADIPCICDSEDATDWESGRFILFISFSAWLKGATCLQRFAVSLELQKKIRRKPWTWAVNKWFQECWSMNGHGTWGS